MVGVAFVLCYSEQKMVSLAELYLDQRWSDLQPVVGDERVLEWRWVDLTMLWRCLLSFGLFEYLQSLVEKTITNA